MGRGRHSYPKVKVACSSCRWKGTRSTFMSGNPCPRCRGRVKEVSK